MHNIYKHKVPTKKSYNTYICNFDSVSRLDSHDWVVQIDPSLNLSFCSWLGRPDSSIIKPFPLLLEVINAISDFICLDRVHVYVKSFICYLSFVIKMTTIFGWNIFWCSERTFRTNNKHSYFICKLRLIPSI